MSTCLCRLVRPVVSLLVFVWCADVVWAAPAASKDRLPNSRKQLFPQGKIAFQSTTIDFSKVPQGSELSHAFYFSNQGTGPLHIKAVHSACGCTIVTMPEAQTFLPGEGSVIQVALKTEHFIGSVRKEITILTDDEANPLQRLRLAADVVPDYFVDPPILAYGEIEAGAPPLDERLVSISPRDPAQVFQILDLNYSSSRLDVSSREVKPNQWQLGVRLKKAESPGVLHEKITVKSNNPHKPLMDIYVTAMVRSPIRVEPAFIDFGTLNKDATAERTLSLASSNEFGVSIEKSSMTLNGTPLDAGEAVLEGLSPAGTARQHLLPLTLRSSPALKGGGNVHGKLHLRTRKDGQDQVITVDFYGFFN